MNPPCPTAKEGSPGLRASIQEQVLAFLGSPNLLSLRAAILNSPELLANFNEITVKLRRLLIIIDHHHKILPLTMDGSIMTVLYISDF